MKIKHLTIIAILSASNAYAENYSVLEQSPEYVSCLQKSILAAPSCAADEKNQMLKNITSEEIRITGRYIRTPHIQETIQNSRLIWNDYALKKCSATTSSQVDLCMAKLADYRASYYLLFNENEGDINTLLKDLNNFELGDMLGAAWINSFIPRVTINSMKNDGSMNAAGRTLNPTTSQELLQNANTITDRNDPEYIRLVKQSAEKGNLNAIISFFNTYLYSGDLKKIKESEKIISEIDNHFGPSFLSVALKNKIRPALINAAKIQGATAYRALMRDLMSKGDEVQMYAAFIDQNLLNGPACENLALSIYNYADSNMADNVKKLAIDNLASGAINLGCLIP